MENGRKQIPAGIVSIYSKCHRTYLRPLQRNPPAKPSEETLQRNSQRTPSEETLERNHPEKPLEKPSRETLRRNPPQILL